MQVDEKGEEMRHPIILCPHCGKKITILICPVRWAETEKKKEKGKK